LTHLEARACRYEGQIRRLIVRRAEVKPQAASQQGNPASSAAADQVVVRPAAQPLSEEQHRVLECLQKAGCGLTTRQIESRSQCNTDVLEGALAGLVERKLVTRLNTIIPSYAARNVSPPIDGR
jgi:hypothetical protein